MKYQMKRVATRPPAANRSTCRTMRLVNESLADCQAAELTVGEFSGKSSQAGLVVVADAVAAPPTNLRKRLRPRPRPQLTAMPAQTPLPRSFRTIDVSPSAGRAFCLCRASCSIDYPSSVGSRAFLSALTDRPLNLPPPVSCPVRIVYFDKPSLL